MQGRLLPKYQGRYQAHPVGYWQDEFPAAASQGLDCIEFILDYNNAEKNPLLTDAGPDAILEVAESSGIAVKTVCADYFMEAPLHSEDEEVALQSCLILKKLLKNAELLGITDIVIPCVDQSSLGSKEMADRFVQNLTPHIENVERNKINLSLETDLAPEPFADLLERFNSNRVTVNYDIGNSASLGYDAEEELACYGDKITDIHIKDRVLGGGPVTLGEGNADFTKFFDLLLKYNYKGPFIMQAYRDDEGKEIFARQLEWIRPYLKS